MSPFGQVVHTVGMQRVTSGAYLLGGFEDFFQAYELTVDQTSEDSTNVNECDGLPIVGNLCWYY